MRESSTHQAMIANAVALACRAPSIHNSQPWRWTVGQSEEGPELRLFLDPHRVPRAADHSGREAVISCGAALHHLRVAAAASGWQATAARFPNPNDLDHLATFTFSRSDFVTDADRARADAILRRRTDRLPFAAPTAWPAVEPAIRSVLDPAEVVLHELPETARPQLAEASRLTEVLRRDDASYHAELAWWTAPFELTDGVPFSALVSDSEQARVDVARSFPGPRQSQRRPQVDHDRSVILVLSTHEDTRQDALGCGEALSEVLLEATVAGLATCTLSHMTEVDTSRSIIRALTGGQGEPQLLIRIGRVPELEQPGPHTPRRPLADVLHHTEAGG